VGPGGAGRFGPARDPTGRGLVATGSPSGAGRKRLGGSVSGLRILPASTNAHYAGSPLAAHFLTLVAVSTIVPGMIHTFLPDGGAGVIAGLDLSANAETVVGVFAWAGATQIVWGATLLFASLRQRTLVPLLLALVAIERTLIALNLWLLKPSAADPRPPEAWVSLLALPLVLLALVLSMRTRRRSP